MSQSWPEVELGDVLTLKRGYDLPNSERRDGNVPIVSSSGVSGYHDEAKLNGPGVVTGRYGTLGEVFLIKEPYWPLNTTLYVQNFKGNDPAFVSYFLRTLNLASQNAAGAVPGLNRNALHLLKVKVPPLPTQRKIAAVLSAYDDLIENNTRRVRVLEDMARALYREWFVEYRFPGHEQAEFVEDEQGRRPAGWEWVPVPYAIEIDPRTKVDKNAVNPFVPMGSLAENSMVISPIEERQGNSGAKFKNGDTLFARITPCLENGKTGYVNFLSDDSATAFGSTEYIVMRSRLVCPEYVYLLARLPEFRDHAEKSMSGASGRQRVKPESLSNYYIAVPHKATLARFQALVKPMFDAVFTLSSRNANLRRTRDLLLPRLVSGELDVSELAVLGLEGGSDEK
ncbi:restriction endonuclease subunit S [Deinococcus taklimakanensis]|uniref:Restriction endonuclease subunit S n=1 Tax=Deinococcus taklimakanensis TaxID=536443 RepID=A0ABW5P7D0_9DEIO